MFLSAPPWLRLGTRSRSVYPSPKPAALPSLGRRSFFKSHLGFQVLLRVVGSRLQPGHSKLAQPLTHGLLAHRHRPWRGNLFAKVDTSPTHHPVLALDKAPRARLISAPPAGLVQSRWAARAGPRSQPCHAIGVEAMNPVRNVCRVMPFASAAAYASDHPAAAQSPKGAAPIRQLGLRRRIPEDHSPNAQAA